MTNTWVLRLILILGLVLLALAIWLGTSPMEDLGRRAFGIKP